MPLRSIHKQLKDPGNNDALAQIGLLLVLKEKGLPTACLEEKAFGARFDSAFWQQLSRICDIELYDGDKNIVFADSYILENIYGDPKYKISANDIDTLNSLTLLELSILSLNNRIDYTGLTPFESIPPHLVKIFIDDPKIPEKIQSNLSPIARFHQFDGYRRNNLLSKNSRKTYKLAPMKHLFLPFRLW